MATALFQCVSEGIAHNLHHCMPVAPCPTDSMKYEAFGKLACYTFRGDCAQMYWWCMELAEKGLKAISFIGVDEVATYPDDPYKVTLLGFMPMRFEQRTANEQYYFTGLIEKFMSAIINSPIEDDWLRRIVKQCVLGQDWYESADFCFKAVKMCEKYGRQIDYRRLLSEERGFAEHGSTMARVLAHVCYLYESSKPQNPVRTASKRIRGLFK